jgi:PIN domain nuclease of toxin-antitoxin system
MRFLLDTHTWLWAVSAPERLRRVGAELIESRENTVVLSTVSAHENAINVSLGKLEVPEPVEKFVSSRIDALAMTTLPVYLSHALRVADLPQHHRDPFDRLLIAQSQIERLPLMTADATIAEYDIEIIWIGSGRAPGRP